MAILSVAGFKQKMGKVVEKVGEVAEAAEKKLKEVDKNLEAKVSPYAKAEKRVETALYDLGRAVVHLLKQSKGDPEAAPQAQEFAAKNETLQKAFAMTKAVKHGEGLNLETLQKLEAKALAIAEDAQTAAKKRPAKLTLSDGTTAHVYPPDIPGFLDMDEGEKQKILEAVGQKIESGKKLCGILLGNTEAAEKLSVAPKTVADVMWFVKGKAEEKMGPFERGALTMPDPNNALRKYLDRCAEVYPRDSSHLKEYQAQTNGQGRGIDFYEGVSQDGIDDVDRLLPCGMRTLLFHQVATAQGEERLYIKMETESCRFNPMLKAAADSPEARPMQKEDIGRSILHLANLVKAMAGMDQGEDKALASFREAMPKDIEEDYKAALASAKAHGSAEAAVILGQSSVRIHEICANVRELAGNKDITVDKETDKHLRDCLEKIHKQYGNLKDAASRFGGEVVLNEADLGLGAAWTADLAKAVGSPMDFLKAMAVVNKLHPERLTADQVKEVIRGYQACTNQTDAQAMKNEIAKLANIAKGLAKEIQPLLRKAVLDPLLEEANQRK